MDSPMPLAAAGHRDAVLWLDADLMIRYASPGVRHISQVPGDQLEGWPLALAKLQPVALEALLACVATAISERRPILTRFRTTRHRRSRPVTAEAVPVQGVGGGLAHVLVVARMPDGSDSDAGAAPRVRDCSMEQAARELLPALAVMRNWTRLLKLQADPADATGAALRRAADGLDAAITRQAWCVTNLIDTAQIDHGVFEVERAPLRLARLAQAAVQSVAALPEAARVRLSLDLRADPWIDGDYERLRRSLCNLLSFIVGHAPDGASIAVALSADARQACLSMRDSGHGAAETPRELFEWPLIDEGEKGGLRYGRAIGLALAQRVCERHGGAIRARRARRGLGAELQLLLPLRPAPLDGADRGGAAAAAAV